MLEVLGLLVLIGILAFLTRRLGGAGPDEEKRLKRKRRGPDMAFSAGRDAAHQNTRLRQVFVPMKVADEEPMRRFYFGIIGLQEMRSPNYPPEDRGFWAVSGTRQIYFGSAPRFAFDPAAMPGFPVRHLPQVAARLADKGIEHIWERPTPYVTQVVVTDPAGNQIALIAA